MSHPYSHMITALSHMTAAFSHMTPTLSHMTRASFNILAILEMVNSLTIAMKSPSLILKLAVVKVCRFHVTSKSILLGQLLPRLEWVGGTHLEGHGSVCVRVLFTVRVN